MVEEVGVDDTVVFVESVFQVGFVTPGLFLAQVCIAGDRITLIVAAVDICCEVIEVELSDILLNSCPELQGRGQVKP